VKQDSINQFSDFMQILFQAISGKAMKLSGLVPNVVPSTQMPIQSATIVYGTQKEIPGGNLHFLKPIFHYY